MRKIDRRIVIIFILVFTLGLAYGIMRYLISLKEEPRVRPQIEAQRFVSAVPVKYQDIISPVVEEGRLSSVSQIDLIAEASGKIQAGDITLKTGAHFKEGDLLFTIYPDEAILMLKAHKSQYQTKLVNLIPDIKLDFEEQLELFISFYESIDLEQALPDLPDFDNEILTTFLASKGVLSDYYTIAQEELALKRRSVYAPFTGTFIDVMMETGAYANTGSRVAKIIRTDRVEMEVPLELFHSEFVNIGDPVEVYSKAQKVSWKGKVVRKGVYVDPGTQTQKIFVEIRNTGNKRILVGEYLQAKFEGQSVKNVMEVDRSGIFNSNEVFIVEEGFLVKKEIEIIKRNEMTVLFRGLEEGSMVVDEALINVAEGTAVSILGVDQVKPPQGRGPAKVNPTNKQAK